MGSHANANTPARIALGGSQWVLWHESPIEATRVGDHHHLIALVVSERGLSEDTNGIGVAWDSIYPRRYPSFMAAAVDPMYATISKKIYAKRSLFLLNYKDQDRLLSLGVRFTLIRMSTSV